MLGAKDAAANLAVKDLDRARKFYEGTLGLQPIHTEWNELVAYKSGSATLYVYRSEYAGTNKATAMTWPMGDAMEDEVRTLKAKGVQFEHYDMPGMEARGDIYVGDGMKIAWFKDPDGNILAVTGE